MQYLCDMGATLPLHNLVGTMYVPCTLTQTAQHDLRNGAMALSWALSQIYRSPIFSRHATQKELSLLKTAMDACERIRLAIEPCRDQPECPLVKQSQEQPQAIDKSNGDGGFW